MNETVVLSLMMKPHIYDYDAHLVATTKLELTDELGSGLFLSFGIATTELGFLVYNINTYFV
jgi:hypothetical protein